MVQLFAVHTFFLLILVITSQSGANLDSVSFNTERQEKLSLIIEETLSKDNVTIAPIVNDWSSPLYTGISSSKSAHCDSNNGTECGKEDENITARVGCCQSTGVRIFYNVKIEGARIVVYSDIKDVAEEKHLLPSIDSMILQKRHGFQMHSTTKYSADGKPEGCSSYFNGTLHVIGRGTVNNVYHAIADNFMPLVALILQDRYLEQEYLHLPRMVLTGRTEVSHAEEVPHILLVDHLLSGGYRSLKDTSTEGMCFSRIVWGQGSHIFYSDTRVVMRRLCARFARILVGALYDMKVPPGFMGSENNNSVVNSTDMRRNKTGTQKDRTGRIIRRRSMLEISSGLSNIGSQHSSAEGVSAENASDRLLQQLSESRHGHHRNANGTKKDEKENRSDGYHNSTRAHRHNATRHGRNSSRIDTRLSGNVTIGTHLKQHLKKGNRHNNSTKSNSTVLLPRLMIHGRPVKIVLYSRGNSGKGRSIKGEDLLINALRGLGALAEPCCDYRQASIDQQIAFAYHADVVLGMHGAALTHAVFARPQVITIELKTLYGYASMLFALVSDSRLGMHGQVDIRKYFVPGGHRPIDPPLIERTMSVLQTILDLQNSGNNTIGIVISTGTKGDIINGPALVTEGLNSVFGPHVVNQTEECENMVMQEVRGLIGSKEDHCVECVVSRRRLLVDRSTGSASPYYEP